MLSGVRWVVVGRCTTKVENHWTKAPAVFECKRMLFLNILPIHWNAAASRSGTFTPIQTALTSVADARADVFQQRRLRSAAPPHRATAKKVARRRWRAVRFREDHRDRQTIRRLLPEALQRTHQCQSRSGQLILCWIDCDAHDRSSACCVQISIRSSGA